MSKYEVIKAATNAYIKTNGRQEITGAILNAVMIATIDSLGKFYQFVGRAEPDTDPGVIDQNIAYLAGTPGTYGHLGGFTIGAGELAVIKFDGEWHKEAVATIPAKVSQLENDLGFITNAVSDLVNYYTKGETFTKSEVQGILLNYYDRDEVDSIVSVLTRQSYVVAWDGTAEPVVGDIPAGVSVTWNGNPYVGTLPASASTIGRIYLVSNGAGYDEYITTEDGGYSWVGIGTTGIDLSGYVTQAQFSQLEAEVHNLSGKYYGVFADETDLPDDAVTPGYAFVGAENPYAIWNFDGEEWSDSGSVANGITGEPGVGFSSIFTPQPYDGTMIIVLSNNDTITVDLNHGHDSYVSKVVGAAQPVGGFLPDVAYNLGEVSGAVTFSLASAVTGQLNHYFWMFSTGASAPTITWPSVTWAAGSAPTVSANKKYEISILGGVAYYSEV